MYICMKIHLIKKQTIEEFIVKNVRSKSSFADWLSVLKYVGWNQLGDIQKPLDQQIYLEEVQIG